MMKWLKNIFKSKYEVWIYEKRVAKYYGLCGWDVVRKEMIVTSCGIISSKYVRLFELLEREKLESTGFALVKIELRYL